MPAHHIGEIIDSLGAERFGHPDMLVADLRELTEHVRQLDEIIAERRERLDHLDEDQPELDDLEFHLETQYERDVIAAHARRRSAALRSVAAIRRRLEEIPATAAGR